jgi:hypothetical protein
MSPVLNIDGDVDIYDYSSREKQMNSIVEFVNTESM